MRGAPRSPSLSVMIDQQKLDLTLQDYEQVLGPLAGVDQRLTGMCAGTSAAADDRRAISWSRSRSRSIDRPVRTPTTVNEDHHGRSSLGSGSCSVTPACSILFTYDHMGHMWHVTNSRWSSPTRVMSRNTFFAPPKHHPRRTPPPDPRSIGTPFATEYRAKRR